VLYRFYHRRGAWAPSTDHAIPIYHLKTEPNDMRGRGQRAAGRVDRACASRAKHHAPNRDASRRSDMPPAATAHARRARSRPLTLWPAQGTGWHFRLRWAARQGERVAPGGARCRWPV